MESDGNMNRAPACRTRSINAMMRMGRDVGTGEERSLYYKFRNKRHKALAKGNSKA